MTSSWVRSSEQQTITWTDTDNDLPRHEATPGKHELTRLCHEADGDDISHHLFRTSNNNYSILTWNKLNIGAFWDDKLPNVTYIYTRWTILSTVLHM